MAHAYTPGLKVLHEAKVSKERRLPVKGEVLVDRGSDMSPDDIVARTHLPGNVRMVNVANLLNVDPADVGETMQVDEGDSIEQGELLAESGGLFGLFKTKVFSPVDGIVESVSNVTGQVVLREAPIPVEIDAYMSGTVVDVFADEGIIIQTDAAFIQGIFGIGGESRGELRTVVDSCDEPILPEKIDDSHSGKILVGGSYVTLEAYRKALALHVAGIVVGGFNYRDLKEVLGYSLGVAITGSEDLSTPLILTEGFGAIAMGQRTFDILRQFDGRFASINGATQIRAGVIRPEIVIPLNDNEISGSCQEIDSSTGITEGSLVRVIRAPYFGKMGRITRFFSELQKMESESLVRVAEVEIDGQRIVLPRANLELVETD